MGSPRWSWIGKEAKFGRTRVPTALDTMRLNFSRRSGTGARLAVLGAVLASKIAGAAPLVPDMALPAGSPPFVLGRLHPAGPLLPGLLAIRFTHEQLTYPDPPVAPADPAAELLDGAEWRREELEVGYGLGLGLTVRADLRFASAKRAGSDDHQAWEASGGEDLSLLVGATSPKLLGRIQARIEGGLALDSGADVEIQADSSRAIRPFTSGESRPRIGAAVSAALTRPDRVVSIHFHAEAIRMEGGQPPNGVAGTPFREQRPLITTGDLDPDRLDLRFGFSFTHRRGLLYAEVEWPVLLEERELISSREVPRMVSPGCALRIRGIEIGGQVDLPWVEDVPETAYDPRATTPDWALRIRLGTDWGIFDRDRDHDLVPDSRDRCPEDPEDRDHYQDEDGCPDPDNDGDGFPDVQDRCPDAAEDLDDFQDEDGCPEPDNDHDGIPDAVDLCPQTAEDPDGYEDQDGCPEAGPVVPPPAEQESNPQGAR
jgi:hypothetical protein